MTARTLWTRGATLLAGIVLLTAAGQIAPASTAYAETIVVHATRSGGQTLDEGEGGGNPFASALIELLSRGDTHIGDLAASLAELTHVKSRGFQEVDAPATVGNANWRLAQQGGGERRIALVLVVSDYSRSGGAATLPGAGRDAQRIAEALERAGYATSLALDRDLEGMRRALAEFARSSIAADAAVIYTTGHGVEVDGRIHLLPGDYPVASRNSGLAERALPLQEIAATARARNVNLVLYAGCRDNPFAE